MTENLQKMLSKLNRYLADYAESGFSAEKAEALLSPPEGETDPLLERVCGVFACSRFERAALLLGLLTTVSEQAAQLAAKLSGVQQGFITPSLVGALFYGVRDILPFADSLHGEAPLTILMNGTALRSDAPMCLKDFVSGYLIDGTIYDEMFLLTDESEQIQSHAVPLCSQQKAEKELVSILEKCDLSQPFILQMVGMKGTGRATCVRRAFVRMKMRFASVFLTDTADSDAIGELAAKLLILGAVPVVSVTKDTERCRGMLGMLADSVGFVIAVSEHAASFDFCGTDTVTVRLSPPTLQENYLLWKELSKAYPVGESVDFSELSGEFEMTPGAVVKALRCAFVLSDGKSLNTTDVKNGCYRSFDADMGDKAMKIEPVFSWDDIVLPEHSKRLLRDACCQVRCHHRVFDSWGFSARMPYGRGVSMIFTGPPGTGKTMAAQVMASELGMEIYKINLANVVSKYIGETEKNLNLIFEKARLCRCILFFDEADVLFSKRTEVKETNDKYSNMESAFLLQKIEEYNGTVILATNLVQNFDEAFKRRMRFIIDFPFPGAEQRREMWHRAFPAQTPVEYIDYDFIVEHFEFSGSNIRNIALHSAFLAASDGSAGVGMKHLMEAIRNEYAKSGKAFTKAEAGEYYRELV